jgi:FkbM family methyltransferase
VSAADSREGVPQGTAPLRLPRGGRATIVGDPHDLSIVEPLRASRGHWEPHVGRTLERVVEPDWVCLDVGANIGTFTLPLACLAARVVAFEANPATFRHLTANVESLGAVASRVTLVQAALLDHPGTLELVEPVEFAGTAYVSTHRDPSTKNRHPHVPDDGRVVVHRVDALRLDDWLAGESVERIDLMKIDVEGAEGLVLQGALELLQRFRPYLVTEYNVLCAVELFGTQPDSYYRLLAERFASIDVIEPDSALARITSWDELEARLEAGSGWVDLFCAPKPALR